MQFAFGVKRFSGSIEVGVHEFPVFADMIRKATSKINIGSTTAIYGKCVVGSIGYPEYIYSRGLDRNVLIDRCLCEGIRPHQVNNGHFNLLFLPENCMVLRSKG
jgi:hypothetical protein